MMEAGAILTVVLALASGLVAWGATRASVVYSAKEIARLHRIVAIHMESDTVTQLEHVQRLARLETLVGEVHAAVVHPRTRRTRLTDPDHLEDEQ